MPTPTITAIITFYRDDRFFAEALASVLAQTRSPDEVIVVDDGSPDDARRSLANLPATVRLIRLEQNAGPGAARQRGADAAQGELLAYLDADDLWMPGKLAAQDAFMAQHPDVAACHTGTVVFSPDGDGKRYLDKPAEQDGAHSVLRGQIVPSALMVRRSAVAAIGGWCLDRSIIEDWDFEIRLTNGIGPLCFIAEPLTRIRRAGHGNLSSRPFTNARRLARTIRRHRALTDRLHGRGAHRAVLARLLQSESWKASWPTRGVLLLWSRVLRIGAMADGEG